MGGTPEGESRVWWFLEDLTLWNKVRKVGEIEERLWKALIDAYAWTEGNKIPLNLVKSGCCVSTRRIYESKKVFQGVRVQEIDEVSGSDY